MAEEYEEEPKNRKVWIWLLPLIIVLVGGAFLAYHKMSQGDLSEVAANDSIANADSVFDNKNAIVEITPEFIKAIEKYDQLGCFSEGYAAVKRNGKWGYINTKGEEVIPATIDAYCVGRFSEGLAFVALTKDADFSVINTKGETLYWVKQNLRFYDEYTSGSPESDDMPYFIDGKLYIQILKDGSSFEYKYQVCDKDGTKLSEIDKDAMREVYKRALNHNYLVYSTEGGEDSFGKDGLKDSNGNVLISPVYGNFTHESDGESIIAYVSNGVVGVQLIEYEEDYMITTGRQMIDEAIKCYYGYADLNGNDTFSDELKRKCRESEKRCFETYREYMEWKENLSSYPSQSSGSTYSDDSSYSGRGYRFSSAQDVIGWLADKSFYNDEIGIRVRIRPEGIWYNDMCATGAPVVERWESWKALIRAYSIANGAWFSLLVDPVNGSITDEAYDVYRLR